MKEFRERHGVESIVLFSIDTEKRLKVRTGQGTFEPAPGERVIAIVPAGKETTLDSESKTNTATDEDLI